jgi:GDP-L-fucose synthase
MSNFWKGKNVIVTGGGGFLGKHLVRLLMDKGGKPKIPNTRDYDLRTLATAELMMRHNDGEADIIINLAANVGGIGYNQNHPYQLFYDNAMIGINLIQAAIKHGVKKFVQIGTTCSYPKFARPPFSEEMLWDGYPEETNAPYGLAKKMLLVQLQAARQEFGFNGIYLIPTNLYGPGDQFAPYKSHVIPALIKKCVEAERNKIDTINVWGTGNASRDFLYVKDAAKAVLLAAEHYDNGYPLNLGSGEEIRIASLVYMISQLTGFDGNVKWDTSKPDGQPRRVLNSVRAAQDIGWFAETKLRDGLRETIEWYRESLDGQENDFGKLQVRG